MDWLQAADPAAEARPDVLGVFATAGTVRSEVYEIEIAKRRPDIAVFSQACPDLVPMVEGGASIPELALAVQAMSPTSRRGSAARPTGRFWAARTMRSSPRCSAPPCRRARR